MTYLATALGMGFVVVSMAEMASMLVLSFVLPRMKLFHTCSHDSAGRLHLVDSTTGSRNLPLKSTKSFSATSLVSP